MKGLRLILITVNALLYSLFIFAQASQMQEEGVANDTNVKKLNIGDKVPDIVFEHVLNYKSSKARLSDFKGKLIILDMWSTWCTSCIEAFPDMQKLQDKYKGKIQILLVNPYDSTYDSDFKIQKTLNRLKEKTGFNTTLPIPVHDTVLNEYFPHQSVPHVVLIDQKGIVRGITYKSELSDQNIQSILAGKDAHFETKNDWAYDNNIQLLVNGNGGTDSNFLYRSIFTPHLDGVESSIGRIVKSNGNVSRFYIINYPILALFQIAYTKVLRYKNNRTVLEVADPTMFISTTDIATKKKNSYCYEITTTPVSGEKMLGYLREDLFRNFKAIARNEIRPMKCYLLIKNNQTGKATLKDLKEEVDIERNSLKKFIHNKPVSVLTEMMNSIFDKPVISETELDRLINIDFPKNIYDYDIIQWKEFLSKSGFDLVEVERKLEVAVITDKAEILIVSK